MYMYRHKLCFMFYDLIDARMCADDASAASYDASTTAAATATAATGYWRPGATALPGPASAPRSLL